jgi:RHS repeat-associated protein
MQQGVPVTKRYFPQGVEVGANPYYYTADRLGSVRQVLDSANNVVAGYSYSPYGGRTQTGTFVSDLGFAGLFHNNASHLDVATFRAYDSTSGRWLNRDPIGEIVRPTFTTLLHPSTRVLGLSVIRSTAEHQTTFNSVEANLYAYVVNDPVDSSDPSGLQMGVGPGFGSPVPMGAIPVPPPAPPDVTVGIDSPIGGVQTTFPFNTGGNPTTVTLSPSYNVPLPPPFPPDSNASVRIVFDPGSGQASVTTAITSPVGGGSVSGDTTGGGSGSVRGPTINFPFVCGVNGFVRMQYPVP